MCDHHKKKTVTPHMKITKCVIVYVQVYVQHFELVHIIILMKKMLFFLLPQSVIDGIIVF